MLKQETAKILAILKAAYPNSYKNMTKEEAQGTIAVWTSQFATMPVSVVLIAVNKLISTNIFPPTISEVKERIRSLYWEADDMLRNHNLSIETNKSGLYGEPLDPTTLASVKEIIKVCEPMRTRIKIEPSLESLLESYNGYLSAPNSDTLKLNEY